MKGCNRALLDGAMFAQSAQYCNEVRLKIGPNCAFAQ
jgi:hypothetical protein